VTVNSDTGTDATILAANSTTAGVLTAEAQTIAGAKTFSSDSYFGGNVGIGNTTPTATLHVDGTVAGTVLATQAEAEAGTSNTKIMTPQRTAQAIAALAVGAASGGGTDSVFFENDQTVTTSYTLTSNKNAMTAGPITINDGVTITIPDGSRWVVV
jgi:hypothetical protein